MAYGGVDKSDRVQVLGEPQGFAIGGLRDGAGSLQQRGFEKTQIPNPIATWDESATCELNQVENGDWRSRGPV